MLKVAFIICETSIFWLHFAILLLKIGSMAALYENSNLDFTQENYKYSIRTTLLFLRKFANSSITQPFTTKCKQVRELACGFFWHESCTQIFHNFLLLSKLQKIFQNIIMLPRFHVKLFSSKINVRIFFLKKKFFLQSLLSPRRHKGAQ